MNFNSIFKKIKSYNNTKSINFLKFVILFASGSFSYCLGMNNPEINGQDNSNKITKTNIQAPEIKNLTSTDNYEEYDFQQSEDNQKNQELEKSESLDQEDFEKEEYKNNYEEQNTNYTKNKNKDYSLEECISYGYFELFFKKIGETLFNKGPETNTLARIIDSRAFEYHPEYKASKLFDCYCVFAKSLPEINYGNHNFESKKNLIKNLLNTKVTIIAPTTSLPCDITLLSLAICYRKLDIAKKLLKNKVEIVIEDIGKENIIQILFSINPDNLDTKNKKALEFVKNAFSEHLKTLPTQNKLAILTKQIE